MTTLADIERERAAARSASPGRTTPTSPEHATLAYDHWQDRRIRWALVLAVLAVCAAGAALVVALRRPAPPPTITRLECPTLPACPAAPTCPPCPTCPAWPTPRERPHR